MTSELTPRQADVLRFIRAFIAMRGYPPSRVEISCAFGWSSPNASQEHLLALERKGAIYLTPGISRGIRIAPNTLAKIAFT